LSGLSIGKIVAYIVSALLVFLGVIFLLASVYAISRLLVGTILTLLGLGIALLTWRRGPGQTSVKYEIHAPGTLKVDSLKCPNCGAALDPSKLQVKAGAPSINCPYCGGEFEVSEEPKW
jgi:predicted RNA-binding Zn-ribbon protein involved in translation (DUF1610 family)